MSQGITLVSLGSQLIEHNGFISVISQYVHLGVILFKKNLHVGNAHK